MMNCPLCGEKRFRVLFRAKGRKVVECLNDGLVFVNPQPTKEEVKGLYGPRYFKNYDPYLKNKDAHLGYFRKKLIQTEKRVGKGKLLDVGCATGFLLEAANKRGWNSEGIDISDFAINYCLKRGLKVRKGILGTLKLPRNTFDAVFSLQTIEHETDPFFHARKIFEILKPGGIAVFTTPDYDSWTRKMMGDKWFGYRHKEHLFFFTKKTLVTILNSTGFSEIEVLRDDTRIFKTSYLLTRLYDFYPKKPIKVMTNLLRKMVGNLSFPIPTDPWGDLIFFAKK